MEKMCPGKSCFCLAPAQRGQRSGSATELQTWSQGKIKQYLIHAASLRRKCTVTTSASYHLFVLICITGHGTECQLFLWPWCPSQIRSSLLDVWTTCGRHSLCHTAVQRRIPLNSWQVCVLGADKKEECSRCLLCVISEEKWAITWDKNIPKT